MSAPSDAEVLAAIDQSCCVDVETFRAWLAEHDERVRLLGKIEGLREAGHYLTAAGDGIAQGMERS